MNRKVRMAAGIALILSIVLPIALVATPALADVNGAENGDQVQDQERLRVRDGSCDGDVLQKRERLRLHEQNCTGDCTGEQYKVRQRAENRIYNNEANLEQCRPQHRQGKRSRRI